MRRFNLSAPSQASGADPSTPRNDPVAEFLAGRQAPL
jgi:hypothetical protein